MKTIKYIKNNIWLSSVFIFCLFFVAYGSVYFFIDGISSIDDHFFHIKVAKLLATDGWNVVDNFNWYPIQDNRLDLSLFQICLIPFTYFGNLFTGLRVSDTFWAALSLAIIYFSLRKFDFKYPFLILIIISSSSHLSYRLFMGRGYVLTIGIMLLELYFAQKKEYSKFFWISFFHILWHRSLFFLPPMIFFAVEISRYLAIGKFKWGGLFASFSAIVCGMFFYPNFPMNIVNWMMGAFKTSSEVNAGLRLEGNELYVKNGLEIFSAVQIFSFLAIISITLVIYLYVKSKDEKSVPHDGNEDLLVIYSFFLMLIVFILGTIGISGRFFDYYFILVIVLFASLLKFVFAQKEIVANERILKYGIAACFIFFSYLNLNNYLDLRLNVAKSDYLTIKAPIEWIRDNSENKEMVYLINWSNFPEAFFYNDKNIYSWGIEPKVLINRDPALYWKAYNIMAYGFYCESQMDCEEEYNVVIEKINKLKEAGEEDEILVIRKENSRKIINSIKNDFGARFILSTDLASTERLGLNEDLIEDKFESVSDVDGNYKITAFKLR